MDRSPGFGSAALNFRPVKTRFRYGFGPEVLNLAQYRNSLARSTKSTQSHINVLLQLVSIRFQVLFHSPHRGSFRLSFTVLVHYRSIRSI